MTMSVEAAGLGKSFGTRAVLQGVDLRVAPGEVFAVVGPSGAGKTTLLRCLDLLLAPDVGAVRYDGREAPAGPDERLALRRRIGMVAQNPYLFRGTPASNVAYGLGLRGVRDPEAFERSRAALAEVGLEGLADRRITTLSAGEGQRVAFARTIVFRPHVLLLDEFTANLDPANVNLLEAAVRQYRQATGATVVVVTHNMFQAKRLASRVALLLEGRIVETSPVDRFFEDPQDPRTRAFVRGEMAY